MNEEQSKATILEVLVQIAPEVDPEHLDPEKSFRDQFDFDSVDFLSFALAVEAKLGIKIPEVDYPRLSSLSGCVTYLRARMEG